MDLFAPTKISPTQFESLANTLLNNILITCDKKYYRPMGISCDFCEDIWLSKRYEYCVWMLEKSRVLKASFTVPPYVCIVTFNCGIDLQSGVFYDNPITFGATVVSNNVAKIISKTDRNIFTHKLRIISTKLNMLPIKKYGLYNFYVDMMQINPQILNNLHDLHASHDLHEANEMYEMPKSQQEISAIYNISGRTLLQLIF